MAVHLFCLSTGGGVPLFTRTHGDAKAMSFPVIGSLNGVHMFGETHGVELNHTDTKDAKLCWKVYHNSITLILMNPQDNSCHYHISTQLDLIFNAMVLVFGLEDFINIKNIERFKKEIKIVFPLIDDILDPSGDISFSHTTCTAEVIAAPECVVLQNYIDAFSASADSPYGALFVSGRMAVATPKWWQFTQTELVLLQMFISSLPKCSSRDVPVFLPSSSPKVPHRLLTFNLVQNVDVCLICGPTPSLLDQQHEVDRFWRSSFDSIIQLPRQQDKTIPTSVKLDLSLLGFLLVNTDSHIHICYIQPVEKMDKRKTESVLSTAKRKDILRKYYTSMTGTLYTKPPKSKDTECENAVEVEHKWPSKPTDSYIVTESYKCYTTHSDAYQFFTLYKTTIPTYALRSVTQKTLQSLLRDKNMKI